MTEFRNEID